MLDRPFRSGKPIRVTLPQEKSGLSVADLQRVRELRQFFEIHRSSLERELGGRLEFGVSPDWTGPRWLVGPFDCNPSIAQLGKPLPSGPEIFLDRNHEILVTDGRTLDEVEETYSYLRCLHRLKGGIWKIDACESTLEAIERIRLEVRSSYPSFALRRLNWDEICERHIPDVLKAEDPIPAMQEWLAELDDVHTWIRPVPAYGELDYGLKVENERGIFVDVPQHSLGWKHGLRPGFELLNEPYAEWWRRTAAPAHSKPFVVGRRILSAPVGINRTFVAKGPRGQTIEWTETFSERTWDPLIQWRMMPSGNGYLKIRAWILGQGLEDKIDQAFAELKKCTTLIVDLRGNPGGNLLMAQAFRGRFLRKEGPVGTIQTTLPDGTPGPKEHIIGERAPVHQRWDKPVRFLTNAMTFSASEDAILGLQGLDHVRVIGEPSGGGSGRMRLIRLLPGWRLTISTALTYDLQGNCIEGSGIPVDISVVQQVHSLRDHVLEMADNAW